MTAEEKKKPTKQEEEGEKARKQVRVSKRHQRLYEKMNKEENEAEKKIANLKKAKKL